MNSEEKILAKLDKHDELFEKMFNQMAQMQATQAQMQAAQAQMQEDIHRINARLDLDAGKRLDALAEGQAVIEKRLDSLKETVGDVKELAEKTADKVDVIKAVVTQHSASITELKKVQ